MALVRGANGEGDELSPEEVERRLLTPAPVERIGEFAFSLWKVNAPLPSRPFRFSRGFVAVTLVGTFALVLVGAWVANRVRQGDFLAAQIFGGVLFLLMDGGLLVAVLVLRRRRSLSQPGELPPNGIPSAAIAATVGVRRRGQSFGWLWFEKDALCFQGVGFDFRLRREDFAKKRSVYKLLKASGTPSLRCPKGVTEYMLSVVLGSRQGDRFVPDPQRWKELEDSFAAWESGAFTSEPSLFPPVRPVPTTPAPLTPRMIVAPALFMAAVLGFTGYVLGPYLEHAKPWWELAPVGALVGLCWPLLMWLSDRTNRSYAREVDRVIRRSPKE